MALLSFISMYLLMYSMINSINSLYPNVNQFYMAELMIMPMIAIELILMRSMYMNKKLNAGIAAALIGLIAFFFCIRVQAGVSDRQRVGQTIYEGNDSTPCSSYFNEPTIKGKRSPK